MKRREDGGGGGVELGVNVLGEMTTRGHPRQHPRYNALLVHSRKYSACHSRQGLMSMSTKG